MRPYLLLLALSLLPACDKQPEKSSSGSGTPPPAEKAGVRPPPPVVTAEPLPPSVTPPTQEELNAIFAEMDELSKIGSALVEEGKVPTDEEKAEFRKRLMELAKRRAKALAAMPADQRGELLKRFLPLSKLQHSILRPKFPGASPARPQAPPASQGDAPPASPEPAPAPAAPAPAGAESTPAVPPSSPAPAVSPQ